jgi:putative ABC transport system permease protein
MTIVIKTKDNPANVAPAVRSVIQSVDSGLPTKFDTMEHLFSKSIANRRYNMLLLGIFAGLALILSMIGVYGVMSYSISQSVHEIGIRIALGAQNSNILRMVLGKGAVLAGIGLVVGTVGAFALTRVMTSLLFGVTTTDPSTFAAVVAGLFTVTMLACYVPARRAMRVDPMVALRNE